MRWLQALMLLAATGCAQTGGGLTEVEAPADGADDAPGCAGLFACMATACTAPPPPPGPPPQDAPWPPPRLPETAGVACLADCAATVFGPDRAAALALASCAKSQCGEPECAAGTAANQCLEVCLWSECAAEMGQCGRGAAPGLGDCLTGLRCAQDLPPQRGLDALLSCMADTTAEAGALLRTALSCVERRGPNAAPCSAPLEACACDGPAPPVAAPAAVACISVLTSCHLGGPCSRAACRARLPAGSQPAADALLGCLDSDCSHCTEASCRQTCAEAKCPALLAACFLDRCAADQLDGDGDCAAGLACVSDCAEAFSPCCLSGCAATMSPTARAAAMEVLACAGAECGCLNSDDVGPCIANCAACAAGVATCSAP